MLVDAKEFLHTIQKHELGREHLMFGICDITNDLIRLKVAECQGFRFYFVFPDTHIGNPSRSIQLILRKPNDPEIHDTSPAVAAYDVMKILSH